MLHIFQNVIKSDNMNKEKDQQTHQGALFLQNQYYKYTVLSIKRGPMRYQGL